MNRATEGLAALGFAGLLWACPFQTMPPSPPKQDQAPPQIEAPADTCSPRMVPPCYPDDPPPGPATSKLRVA